MDDARPCTGGGRSGPCRRRQGTPCGGRSRSKPASVNGAGRRRSEKWKIIKDGWLDRSTNDHLKDPLDGGAARATEPLVGRGRGRRARLVAGDVGEDGRGRGRGRGGGRGAAEAALLGHEVVHVLLLVLLPGVAVKKGGQPAGVIGALRGAAGGVEVGAVFQAHEGEGAAGRAALLCFPHNGCQADRPAVSATCPFLVRRKLEVDRTGGIC